jgi:succinate dehydrogenase / fumarate reductase, iron-sulfur subunit
MMWFAAELGGDVLLVVMRFSVFRFDPDADSGPRMQDYDVELGHSERMVLDAMLHIKQIDESFAFRKSCREGICGSDAVNINGRNRLACVTRLSDLQEPITLRPLPGQPVIRDLIVDLTQFFTQYHAIRPYLINDEPAPDKERLQSPEERAKLDGLCECILCACCSTACPSFWWNPDKFIGPAGLLQAYRFLVDSRDRATKSRLAALKEPYKLFRCRTVMNCTEVCPKGLSPSRAIERTRLMMLELAQK